MTEQPVPTRGAVVRIPRPGTFYTPTLMVKPSGKEGDRYFVWRAGDWFEPEPNEIGVVAAIVIAERPFAYVVMARASGWMPIDDLLPA